MRPRREAGILTVANIRRARGKRSTEVRFNEKQQIFRLPARAAVSNQLRDALKKNRPVKVVLDPRRGVVRTISDRSERERREFERTRTYLDKPDKTVRINVADIDPAIFNIVDRHLKFPTFRLCTRIMRNYKTAKKIFDFCAAQSCHLPGPPTVTPCVPFQYVRDGCYARAHKMRKIITERYHYCCEKVFSFANENNDDLAVRADKWGGCHMVVPRSAPGPSAIQDWSGNVRARPRHRPEHVRQAGSVKYVADGAGEYGVCPECTRVDVFDTARVGIRAGKLP